MSSETNQKSIETTKTKATAAEQQRAARVANYKKATEEIMEFVPEEHKNSDVAVQAAIFAVAAEKIGERAIHRSDYAAPRDYRKVRTWVDMSVEGVVHGIVGGGLVLGTVFAYGILKGASNEEHTEAGNADTDVFSNPNPVRATERGPRAL